MEDTSFLKLLQEQQMQKQKKNPSDVLTVVSFIFV